jgi:hypothetical protein
MSEWDDDLDLGPAPRYPLHLHHAIFDAWPDDHEEDMQTAALGWILTWRQQGNTLFFNKEKAYLALPVPDTVLFDALHARILDWLWTERGGAVLAEVHNLLLQRHHLRLKESTPCR